MTKKKTDDLKGEVIPEVLPGEKVISEECVAFENATMEGSSEIACFAEEADETPDSEEAGEAVTTGEATELTAEGEDKEAAKEKKKERIRKTKLCKLVKKDFQKKHTDEYIELVANPTYVCRKCGRAAKEMKSLCKPMPLIAVKEESVQQ